MEKAKNIKTDVTDVLKAVLFATLISLAMVLIFAISVVLLRKTKWNPVFVMILAGVLKVLVALI